MLYLPLLISIVEVLIVTVPVLTVAFVTVAEKKTMASILRRLGPNIVGYFDFLQELSSPPKPHAFVSLPVQSGLPPRKLNKFWAFIKQIWDNICTKKFIFNYIMVLITGFIIRYVMLKYYNINVFTDIYDNLSVIYFGLMGILSFRLLIFALLVLIIAFNILLYMLEQSTIGNVTLCILFIIFYSVLTYLALTYFYLKPIHCESFVSEMDRGVIPRTPLLQPGQTLANLQPGTYRVTGGYITVGFLPRGNVMKMLGVMVDGYPNTLAGWDYQHGHQPFNMNFAKVLYEFRAAGKNSCSYTSLDYAYAGRDLPQANVHSQYIRGFKAARGLAVNSENHGELTITTRILNALAEQEH